MEKQASEERVASSGNGFAYVAVGALAILVTAALLLARPSLPACTRRYRTR